MQSSNLVDVNSLIDTEPPPSQGKVDVSSLIEQPTLKKKVGGSDVVNPSSPTELPSKGGIISGDLSDPKVMASIPDMTPEQAKQGGNLIGNGAPTAKSEFDGQNPIDLAKQAADLSTKSQQANVPTMVGGASMGTTSSYDVPDENAIKQSNKINDYLKSQKIDPKEVNKVFGDLPPQAYGMTLPDGTKPQSKEQLFSEWKANPIDAENKIDNIKTQFALQDAGKNKALQSNPNDQHSADQYGIQLGNSFMQLQGTPVNSMDEYYSKIQKQQQLINENLEGDAKQKALERLHSTSAPNINANQPQLIQEYEQSDLRSAVNPTEYAGLQTLKLFDPGKYQQAVNILSTKITPSFTNPTNVPTGTLSGGAPIPATYQSATKQKGGELSQDTIDQQIAQETMHRQLLNIGRENELQNLTASQYNLNSQYEQADDPNKKEAIKGQYVLNQAKINSLKTDAANDDKQFPLTANLKFDNEVKDITGQTDAGVMQYGTERFLKGFQNTQNTAEDILTGLFGSKQDNTDLGMKRIGESQNWESAFHLPESLNTSSSPYILKATKQLQSKADKILNGRSLSDLSPDETGQLKQLVARNPSQITTVANPDADKSKNFFSKATAYATAGFSGDIASFMAQTYGLGALGLSGKAAEAATLFNTTYSDAYDEAIKEGNSSSIANQKAMVNGGIMALAGIVSSKYDVAKNMLKGGSSTLSKEIAGISEDAWNNIVNKNKSLISKIGKSVTSTAGENAKMIATYGVGTTIANDLASKAVFNKDISTGDIINHALQSSKDMALGSAALMGVGFLTNAIRKPVTLLDKTNLWELGTNPEIGKAKIDEALENNQITQAQADQRKATISKVSDLIQQVPEYNKKGKPLTDEQKVRYMYNEFNKSKIKEAEKSLPETQKEKTEAIINEADVENSKILSGNEKEIEVPNPQTQTGITDETVNKVEQPTEEDNSSPIKTTSNEKSTEATEGGQEVNTKPDEPVSSPVISEKEGKEHIVDENVSDLSKKSDKEIEDRMSEIESSPMGSMESMNEFNGLEKEMEKRERDSVFTVPLDKVSDAVDALMKKEKEKPNGYGSFIEKRDANETKAVAERYLHPDLISDGELKSDFKESVRGNPTTWYADGLKLRESLKEATQRGIDTKDMIGSVMKVYTDAGYDEQTAKEVVAHMLKPVFEGSQKVETNEGKLIPPNETKATTGIDKTIQPEKEVPKLTVEGNVPIQKVGKYEAKAKEIADKINKAELPGWLINSDPTISKSGIGADDLKKYLADATVLVGKALDKGVELADAIKEGAKSLIDDYTKGLGAARLKPEFEKQLREGFENYYKESVPSEPPKPPKEEAATAGGDDGKVSGVKKSITEPLRTELGLPKVELPKMGEDNVALQDAKKRIDSGEVNPRDLVSRILDKKEGYKSEEEVMDMQYYAHQIQFQADNLQTQKTEAKTDFDKAEVSSKLQQLSDESDRQTKAALIAGNQWGKIGNRMQIVIDAGFNPSREKVFIKDIYGGEMPADVKSKFDAIAKERDDAIEAKKRIEELLRQKAGKEGVNRIKKDAEKTKKIDETKEKLKAEEQELLKEVKKALKKDFGNLNAGIPVPTETLNVIGKLAVNYFKQGAVSIESLVNKMYEALKDDIDGLDKKQIRDFISEYEPLTIERETSKLNKKAEGIEDKTNPTVLKTKNGKLAGVNEPVDLAKPAKTNINFRNNTEWVKAQQRVANAEYKMKVLKRKAFESKKNFYQKSLMWAARMFRLSVLSGTNVLYKLSSAATIGGAGMRVPSEAIGGIYSGIFKALSDRAPIEGGFNIKAQGRFYKEFFNPKKFGENTWQILKTGQSNLSKRLGSAEYEHVPILYLPTDLHQVIKDPVKRATFEVSMIKSMAWAEKNGLDINDNLVYQSLENAAYKRANYEIFQEKNWLSDKFQAMKSKLDKGGNIGATGKFLVDFMIPVSTVPTNIVRRMVTTSPAGLVRGALQVREAYAKGIEKLDTEQADKIMRQLKQGSLGTALYLTGWFAASHFGGLFSKFSPDKKRATGDLVHDQMEIDGVMYPKPIQHALPFEIIQFAATSRRVYDNYVDNKGSSNFEAIYNAGLGSIGALLEQVPVVETGVHLVGATKEPYEAKKLKEDVERRFEPQILRETGVIGKGNSNNGEGGGASGSYHTLKMKVPTIKVPKVPKVH